MGQAITYALNQWEALCVYATDGDLAIDNNAAENALRRVAIGRKNWLFCGSDNGGNTAAILFSLIATCQRHKVDPFAYLRDVLTRIAAHPITAWPNSCPTGGNSATPESRPTASTRVRLSTRPSQILTCHHDPSSDPVRMNASVDCPSASRSGTLCFTERIPLIQAAFDCQRHQPHPADRRQFPRRRHPGISPPTAS